VFWLVLLGDILFWDRPLGISLAVFAMALVLAAGTGRPAPARIKGGAICLIGALPVADHVQALSLIFLATGTIGAIVVQHAPGDDPRRRAARAFGLLLGLPGQWLRSLVPPGLLRAKVPAVRPGAPGQRMRLLKEWAFPLGGSLVFLALLMDANPLFLSLGTEIIAPWQLLQRGLFWAGIALFIMPFLLPALPEAQLPGLPQLHLPRMRLSAPSVLRALVMFNLLIGVQMLSDMAILIGGADLPRGMTYAEYAHRGAYPLLATAMLAMGFAVLARPFQSAHRLIRPLMLLWLAQNIVLTGAAALRLDLYIAAYGLTYLRLYALIWMGLVAFGLGLAALQMMLERDTSWLIARAAAGAAVTLYACAFVNFAGIIAAQNLARPKPDLAYICALGPMAAGALAAAGAADGTFAPPFRQCAALVPPPVQGWRDWGLRGWQVNHMVEAARLPEQAG